MWPIVSSCKESQSSAHGCSLWPSGLLAQPGSVLEGALPQFQGFTWSFLEHCLNQPKQSVCSNPMNLSLVFKSPFYFTPEQSCLDTVEMKTKHLAEDPVSQSPVSHLIEIWHENCYSNLNSLHPAVVNVRAAQTPQRICGMFG